MSRCISHSVMCLAVFGQHNWGEQHWWSLAGSRLVRQCHGDPDYQWQPSQQGCSSSPSNIASTVRPVRLGAFLDDHPAVRDSLRSAADELTDACRTNQEVYAAHRAFTGKLQSLNLEKQLLEYDVIHEKDPMYKWARMYMNQVMVLLQFQRATREGNWFLYLAALEKLCVYFFAYNRLDYAQNIPEYIARMYDMKPTDPDIWQEFVNGEFTVNTSNAVPFIRIGVD